MPHSIGPGLDSASRNDREELDPLLGFIKLELDESDYLDSPTTKSNDKEYQEPKDYIPAVSEVSWGMLDHEEMGVAGPEAPSDSESMDSEDTEQRVTSEGPESFVCTPSEDLLELPWFHRNVRRVLRGLLQQWPAVRTAPHHQPQSAVSSQQGLGEHGQQGSGGRKRRKEQADSGDEASQREPPPNRVKRARRSTGSTTCQPFSCPFCKKDLQRYRACAKFGLSKVSHVKQHVQRKHSNEVDDLVMNRLKRRSARGTEKEKWYGIFDLLFPGHSPRPASPYNDFTVSEQSPQALSEGVPIDEALYIPGVFLTEESVEILHQSLVQDPVFAGVREEDIRRAVDLGLSRALMGQISRSVGTLHAGAQRTNEGDTTSSDQSSNTRAFGNLTIHPRTGSDECEPENKRPRGEIREDTQHRGSAHNTRSVLNESSHDQQLSLGGQPGLGDGSSLGFSSTEDQLPPVLEHDYLLDFNSILDLPIDEGWQAIASYDWGLGEGS